MPVQGGAVLTLRGGSFERPAVTLSSQGSDSIAEFKTLSDNDTQTGKEVRNPEQGVLSFCRSSAMDLKTQGSPRLAPPTHPAQRGRQVSAPTQDALCGYGSTPWLWFSSGFAPTFWRAWKACLGKMPAARAPAPAGSPVSECGDTFTACPVSKGLRNDSWGNEALSQAAPRRAHGEAHRSVAPSGNPQNFTSEFVICE